MLIHSRDFPGWFVWFGWLMVLPGPLSFPFPPAGFIYLQLTIVWAAALGVYLRSERAARRSYVTGTGTSGTVGRLGISGIGQKPGIASTLSTQRQTWLKDEVSTPPSAARAT